MGFTKYGSGQQLGVIGGAQPQPPKPVQPPVVVVEQPKPQPVKKG